MAFLRHLLESLINPFFLVFALSSAGFFIRNDLRFARAVLIIIFASLLVFSTGFVPRFITETLEQKYPRIEKANPAIELVVVLGGGQAQYGDGLSYNLLTSASIRRLIEGVRLYRQLPNARLIVSGGEYKSRRSEARLLQALTTLMAIPVNDVILEEKSINTADQAIALKQLVGIKPFYLVTSAIHMPRAMALCKKQGLNPIAAPTDYTYYWYDERWEKMYFPTPQNLVYLNIAWHEILGRTWAKITGQI